MIWERCIEKVTRMSWWNVVAKGLMKQSQYLSQNNAKVENGETLQVDSSLPATQSMR